MRRDGREEEGPQGQAPEQEEGRQEGEVVRGLAPGHSAPRSLAPGVAKALTWLRRARDLSDEIIVAFSGGKDSLAVLELAVEAFGRQSVSIVHWYVAPGLEVVDRWVRWAHARYGVRVAQVPHMLAIEAMHTGRFMPLTVEGEEMRFARLADVERATRSKLGDHWHAYGHRVNDSIQRRGMLKNCQGFYQPGRRVYPIYDWTSQQVIDFLRLRKIPLPERRTGLGGVSLAPKDILWLYDQHRADYERMRQVYPGIETVVVRRTMFGNVHKPPKKARRKRGDSTGGGDGAGQA